MFLDNKYTRIYYQIINRAKSRPKPLVYTEKHHIILNVWMVKKLYF